MVRRILTAAFLIPLALGLVLWAPWWLFFLGLLPFALFSLWEYLELMGRVGSLSLRLPVYVVTLTVWAVAAVRPDQLLAALSVGALILVAAGVLGQGRAEEIPWTSSVSVFGLVYVGLPFAIILLLRGGEQGSWVLLYGLILVWVGDTAAYFVGRAIGRHKLAPAISPGKTVEGTVGGLVVTVAVGYWLFQLWFPAVPSAAIHAFILPLVVNGATQLGDLAESGLKRGAGVKDSSALLPGHGGMLDRVDGLLFAIPALWYYWNGLIWGGF
jgi:phosphatidate cytidylyltransferase